MRKTISIVALVIAVCVLIKILFPTPILSLKCHFDDNKSCVELGRDKQSRGDYESSRTIFAKACDLGDIDSCFEVGILYDNGDKVDAIKASKFYLKACEKSKAVSCHKLGNLYQKGLLEKDYKKAVKFYEKACDLGYGKSCHNGGSVYIMGGFGLEADHKKAFGFFKKGCEHDMPDSRYNVAFSYQQGDGTQMNYDKAIEFYTKACDLGFSYACGNLGVLYVGGSQNVEQDLRKALDYFVRACDLGNEKICEKLQWIKDTISIDQPQN